MMLKCYSVTARLKDAMLLIVSLIGLAYFSLPSHAGGCNRVPPQGIDCSAALINCPLFGPNEESQGNIPKQTSK